VWSRRVVSLYYSRRGNARDAHELAASKAKQQRRIFLTHVTIAGSFRTAVAEKVGQNFSAPQALTTKLLDDGLSFHAVRASERRPGLPQQRCC